MKNRKWKSVVLILIALLITLFSSCTYALKTKNPGKQKGFSVSVDARMELLGVVQHFTSWAKGGHIKSQTTYKDDIDRYFEEFEDHPVIECIENLTDAGFTHDAPVRFMLYHGNPPELVQKTPYSVYLIKRAGGKEKLNKLAELLRDFASKTNFMQFYNNHEALYDSQITEVKSLLKGKEYVQAIEDFFGESKHNYFLILPPLFAGGYGPIIQTEKGDDIYGVVGPCALKGNRVTFACLDYLESIMLHEWSHSFVNPLVDKHYDSFKKSSHLFQPIKGMMRKQAYPNWRVTLYEHIVRACETNIRATLYEDFNKVKFLKYQEGKGFWYIKYIDSLLVVYQNQRDKYPTLDKFIPVISERLSKINIEDLSEELTTFLGPLDGIFPRSEYIHFVYPTNIEKKLIEKIKQDLEQFAGLLAAAQIKTAIISDKDALGTNWEDKVAFIYGNQRDNLFLKEINPGIPIGYRNNSIEFGEELYKDEGIVIVSCMQNPFNKMLPFALCVANRAEDLLEIGFKMSGKSEWNADYVIFQGDEIVDSGIYTKEKGYWTISEKKEKNEDK
jgi:hypothetical protein